MQALSEASLEDVNSMWAGLGYYRRARFLLEGAQYVVQHHGGSFPKTSKELQKIPGKLLGNCVVAGLYNFLCGPLRSTVHSRAVCLYWISMPLSYDQLVFNAESS